MNQNLDFENILLDRLSGKLHSLQKSAQRQKIIEKELLGMLADESLTLYRDQRVALSEDEARRQFIENFSSYGPITDLLSDFNVEDIMINSLNPIYIHHSQSGLIRTDKRFLSNEDLNAFIRKLAVFTGRSTIRPIMNLELPNLEGRVNLVKSPFGPQLTIAKAKMAPLSILDLIQRGLMSYEVAGQLWLYVDGMNLRPANIIIAGGPGVGKTTLLNALFSFVPESHRLVVIEDTLELNTEFEDSCSRLECGEDFSLADLVKNSLRMRPERIVVGEVRGSEARDMITAANIGKYCIGTVHALTSREAIIRLQNEPMNIPEELVRLIDVFIVLKRYHVENMLTRVVDEVSETSGMEQEKVLLSQIYKYEYETKTINSVSTSTIYRDRLAHEAALKPRDIILEVQLRAFLLEELVKRGLTTIREVTSFCRLYSQNPDQAVASLGLDRQQLLGRK